MYREWRSTRKEGGMEATRKEGREGRSHTRRPTLNTSSFPLFCSTISGLGGPVMEAEEEEEERCVVERWVQQTREISWGEVKTRRA